MNKAFTQLLYANTYFAYMKYINAAESTDEHVFAHGEFCGLYNLIVSAGLENAYYEWRECIAERDIKMDELRDELQKLINKRDEKIKDLEDKLNEAGQIIINVTG